MPKSRRRRASRGNPFASGRDPYAALVAGILRDERMGAWFRRRPMALALALTF